ncbi:MAG: hypothetical protein AMXMBFR47_14300 [Planctomycetota bacterium]
MIFVTVGAQMPFDRLILAVDAWAAAHPEIEVFAQIGDRATPPRHMAHTVRLDSREFVAKVRSADMIVAHAGIGSILTALEHARAILVMPRRGDLGETRNDHQLATARRFAASSRVQVAKDEHDLAARLDELTSPVCSQRFAAVPISAQASPQLLAALNRFIMHGEVPHSAPARTSAPRAPAP